MLFVVAVAVATERNQSRGSAVPSLYNSSRRLDVEFPNFKGIKDPERYQRSNHTCQGVGHGLVASDVLRFVWRLRHSAAALDAVRKTGNDGAAVQTLLRQTCDATSHLLLG